MAPAKIESGAQAVDADMEKLIEELAPVAEDAAQGPGHGEDELVVREDGLELFRLLRALQDSLRNFQKSATLRFVGLAVPTTGR